MRRNRGLKPTQTTSFVVRLALASGLLIAGRSTLMVALRRWAADFSTMYALRRLQTIGIKVHGNI